MQYEPRFALILNKNDIPNIISIDAITMHPNKVLFIVSFVVRRRCFMFVSQLNLKAKNIHKRKNTIKEF